MKKNYSKPEIMFESFVASSSLAACKIDTDLPSTYTCGIPYAQDKVIFIDSTTTCNVPTPDDGSYNDICYHNPFSDKQLFGS